LIEGSCNTAISSSSPSFGSQVPRGGSYSSAIAKSGERIELQAQPATATCCRARHRHTGWRARHTRLRPQPWPGTPRHKRDAAHRPPFVVATVAACSHHVPEQTEPFLTGQGGRHRTVTLQWRRCSDRARFGLRLRRAACGRTRRLPSPEARSRSSTSPCRSGRSRAPP
jgi:hypothetical protein